MSNSPTAPISTTASSSNCSCPNPPTPTIIACGALAKAVRQVAATRGWKVRVAAVPASFHNDPRHIVPAVERLATAAARAGHRVAVAFADCGSYGGLGQLCAPLGIAPLGGPPCFGVFPGPDPGPPPPGPLPATHPPTHPPVRTLPPSA